MKAEALTPNDLFAGRVQFEIPSFQRPYVWTEENQWAPLWADVKRVAAGVVHAGGKSQQVKEGAHFLGAIVIKETNHHAGDVARSTVIDGQQRMTTLQILLDAAHTVVDELDYEDEAEALQELILNRAKRFDGKKERFKLWPDRAAFEAAMDDETAPTGDHRISEAHAFFAREVRRWVVDGGDEEEPVLADQATRAAVLADVLASRLYFVAINLGVSDDDQLIFETLNDRGTPLLAADLIKNWVFQRAEELGADTEKWAEDWAELDEEWWRHEISQGRLLRSRIDIFLQYWLTMRTKEEIPTDGVFRRFRDHALKSMSGIEDAEDFLRTLRRDADTFRSFAELAPDTAAGRFYATVIEAFELAATTPLLLWMLSDNHAVPASQVEAGLDALESWVVRRTLLRMTMKDVNKLMVAMLVSLDSGSAATAGDAVHSFLAGQTADARVWPSDADMVGQLPSVRLYGNVQQRRLRVVLKEIERGLRTEKNEQVGLPGKLEIEHVMPTSWQTHWDETPPLTADAASVRSKHVNTLGNLTLVSTKLNGSLSHRPWTDDEAFVVAPKGKDAGLGKRTLLERHSLLMLNKDIIGAHPTEWNEADIQARGTDLTERVCSAWRGPSGASSLASA